ncbi:MAG: hypothetical protein IK076_02470, partial [Bacteroidales bacterium]|nr:hypothetical protein [Bacteroidales bacterium]
MNISSHIFKAVAAVFAMTMVLGCNNAAKKKAAAEQAEQARLDSIAAVEKAEQEKKAMNVIANLPEEPVFDIITNLGTISVRLYSKTPKHR